jgi:hypothetical protein
MDQTKLTRLPAQGNGWRADHRDRRGRLLVGLRLGDAAATAPGRSLTYVGPTGYRTYSSPHRFVDDKGRIVLVKARAQQGLGAEAFANILAHQLDAGPESFVIDIGAGTVPEDGRLNHLIGLKVATVELEGTVNHEQLFQMGGAPNPDKVDWESWARVVAFQTWIYAGDPQAVFRWSDGRVFSVDHGACFRELLRGGPAGVIVPELHGVAGVPFDRRALARALDTIESITESDLVEAASGIPDGPDWRMPIDRRLRIVEWLLNRQIGVRKVVEWNLRLS